MSVTELVILSSSPTTKCNYIFSPPRSAQPQAWNTRSASPDLPTVSNLLATRDVGFLHNETHAATVKEGPELELENARPQAELAGKKAKRMEKVKDINKSNAGQALAAGSDNPVKKKPRQRKKKVAEQSRENDEVSRYFDQNEQDLVNEDISTKKARKKRQTAPRTKRSKGIDKEGDSQAKLVKTRITKPSLGLEAPIQNGCPVSDEKEEGQVSFLSKDRHLKTDEAHSRESTEKNLSNSDNELNFALPRRTNWTPPKCSAVLPPSNQAELYQGQVTSETLVSEPSIFKFLPDYRFDSTVSKQIDTLTSARISVEAPTKKRRLETTQLPESGQIIEAVTKPKQQRAKKVTQKKKARTITELAMAQYRLPDGDETSVAEVEPRTLEPPTLENITIEAQPKKPLRRKKRDTQSSDSKTKIPETKIKKKKAVKKPKKSDAEPTTRLLSPKAALASLQHQDLLFGTSSQLAREESPPCIRDLQRAFAESEKVVLNRDTTTAPSCLVWKSKLSATKRNLWEAAARDHDDELLLESKENSPHSDYEILKETSHADYSLRKCPDASDTRHLETSEICKPNDIISTADETNQKEQKDPPAIKVINVLPTPENSNTSARIETPPQPPPSPPESTHNHQTNEKSPEHPSVSSPYEVLSPETPVIKKPITPPFLSHSLSQISSFSKESTGWTHIDEISDSEPEPEFTPSPPRRAAPPPVSPLKFSRRLSSSTKLSSTTAMSKKQRPATATKTTSNPSKPTSTSSGMTPDSANWAAIAPSLFAQITATVKASPPSSSSSSSSTSYTSNASLLQNDKIAQPSWYERMLMYEPIDIEALTVWLNEQGLRVPVMVKATVRRKNRRGVTNDGGGDDDDDDDDGKVGRKEKDKPKKKKKKKKKKQKDEQIAEEEKVEEEEGEAEVKNKALEDGELRQELRELSSWMVRKWCQEFSVCCVWRDGVNGWNRK